MKDYVCPQNGTSSSTCTYPISNYLNYNAVLSTYQSYLAATPQETEPISYIEAMKDLRWVEAMKAEVDALVLNNTWEIVDIPKGKVPIGRRWVYKIKYRSTGEVERFKARLVAKGYNQQEGPDYQEIFSPVVKMVTVRAVIALDVMHQWPLFQLDVYNTFLQGGLEEEVYMQLPPSFSS